MLYRTPSTNTKKVYKYEFEDVHEYESGEVHAGIRILEGPYKGLLYAYRKVQLIPDPENDCCHAKFEWIALQNEPENDTVDLYDVLGDILMDIIDKDLEEQDKDFQVDEE